MRGGGNRSGELFRWFAGIGVDDPAGDHPTFSKNRDRLLTPKDGSRGEPPQGGGRGGSAGLSRLQAPSFSSPAQGAALRDWPAPPCS